MGHCSWCLCRSLSGSALVGQLCAVRLHCLLGTSNWFCHGTVAFRVQYCRNVYIPLSLRTDTHLAVRSHLRLGLEFVSRLVAGDRVVFGAGFFDSRPQETLLLATRLPLGGRGYCRRKNMGTAWDRAARQASDI